MNFRLPKQFYLPRPFGEPEVFRLLDRLRATGWASAESREFAEETLMALIRSAAAGLRVPIAGKELLVPGACPVVPSGLAGVTIHDPLSAMAVITQSTNRVWLRDREPRLHRITCSRRSESPNEAQLYEEQTVSEVALWIPPPTARR